MQLALLITYLFAFAAYTVHFARRDAAAGRGATALLVAGAMLHTFIIGMQTMEAGHVPFAGATQAISTFVWLLALAYLYTEVTTEERGLGIFILPIIVLLQLLPTIQTPSAEPRSPVLESPLFWIHVSALLGSYASFGLAAVIGVTYVLQFKEIKKKHLGFFYTRLPSLQTLDVMNARAITIGWLFLTIGVVVGAIWTAQARAIAPDDPNLQAMALNDPKVLFAIFAWAVYSFVVVARRTMGWSGRRTARLSVFGFVIVLLNLLPINYFVTTSHTF